MTSARAFLAAATVDVHVRVGFVKCHEVEPLESFREAVMAVLPDDAARERLKPLPERGEFDVRRVPESDYFFC